MSSTGKIDLARGWQSALRLRDEEADRLAKMSDDEFAQAMDELPPLDHAPTVLDSLVSGRGESRPLVERAKGPRHAERAYRLVWLLAAAFSVLMVLGIAKRDNVKDALAVFWDGRSALHIDPVIRPVGPTPEELASILRSDAKAYCGHFSWDACAAFLNEARKLDPASENSPDVQRMREDIDEGLRHPPGELETKPRPR